MASNNSPLPLGSLRRKPREPIKNKILHEVTCKGKNILPNLVGLGSPSEVMLLKLIRDDIAHRMPAYSWASMGIFPLHTPPVEVARQQGDRSARGCDFSCRSMYFYLHSAKQLSYGDFSSKAKYSSLCFSAYIISRNGMAQFLRLRSQGSPTSAFNRLCQTSRLKCLPIQWKDFQSCFMQALVLCP